jgi:hypothetical protein
VLAAYRKEIINYLDLLIHIEGSFHEIAKESVDSINY